MSDKLGNYWICEMNNTTTHIDPSEGQRVKKLWMDWRNHGAGVPVIEFLDIYGADVVVDLEEIVWMGLSTFEVRLAVEERNKIEEEIEDSEGKRSWE